MIVGDFNIHYEDCEKPDVKKCMKTLQANGLVQQVTQPTHKSGHTLDWIVTRESESVVNEVVIEDRLMSDHFWLLFSLDLQRPPAEKIQVKCRNIKSICIQDFKQDLQESKLLQDTNLDLDEMVELYNSTLTNLLDKHAPSTLKTVRVKPNAPWYCDEICAAKQKRREAERKWRKSRLTVHREIYRQTRNDVNRVIREVKAKFHHDTIASNLKNPKALWSHMSRLLGKEKNHALPKAETDDALVTSFNDFFSDKINKIMSGFPPCSEDEHDAEQFSGSMLECFQLLSEAQVLKIIEESNPTTCELDPIPTSLLRELTDVLLPVITSIMNTSLQTGTVPKDFKSAVVKPLLKKANLNENDFRNYRPVSNLSFLSKILEKAVNKQLSSHLEEYQLIATFQSAYRKAHSTETALLRVVNDLRTAVDDGKVAAIVLLDLSAAFDTINHKKLLKRLQVEYGLGATILTWFESYISDRKQSVVIRDSQSYQADLVYGVPQGSVLGPILFTLYTKQLSELIERCMVLHHLYADDTQLIDSFQPNCHADIALNKLEYCCNEIKSWMNENMLKLNEEKTQVMLVGPASRLAKVDHKKISVGQSDIIFSCSVKNLGVHLQSDLTMEKQVAEVCKSCYFHLRNIGRIRHLLTEDTTAALMRALILSRLDYCNSLLTNISQEQIQRLQRIQNRAARIVTRTPKFDSITPALKSLHWLPVMARIDFKVLSLTYQCIHGTAPTYLSDLIKPYQPTRNLRSSNKDLLYIPPYKLKTFGLRSFSVAAPLKWNALPDDLKQSATLGIFKAHLKTHLFKSSFNH